MSKLSLAEKRAAVELQKAGLSNKQIAEQLNFSQRAIYGFLRRYAETGDLNQKSGSGRLRGSTACQDATLEKLCLADRKASATELNKR